MFSQVKSSSNSFKWNDSQIDLWRGWGWGVARTCSYPEKTPLVLWAVHPVPLGKEHGLKCPPCTFPHDNQEFPSVTGNAFPFDMNEED